MSAPAGYALPSGVEPVRMSCRFGAKPLPGIWLPRSSSAVNAAIRFAELCSWSTFCAICAPRTLNHGPEPIRSRALTAFCPCVLRYARQVRAPCPAAWARSWQIRSAPARPPKLPPLPEPRLVRKNDIGPVGGCASAKPTPTMPVIAATAAATFLCFFMGSPVDGTNQLDTSARIARRPNPGGLFLGRRFDSGRELDEHFRVGGVVELRHREVAA